MCIRDRCYSFCFLFLIVIFIFDRKYLPKYFYVIPLILVPIVIYYIMQLDDVMNIFKMLESRGDNESSLGGGRYYKYIYMLDNFNFKPFGIGYNITVNDVIFKPHSDFIMLVLSYGIIVLVIFFYMICPRIKEQAYLFIPFIFGFLINSILDEYRLICVFFILTGLLYENYKVQKRDKI
ncbi:O-antigen ligase family protein [Photobacterium phosphoreum]|uniref:O-antigen ligase family protein n=1 Tax=Photobacterium phosphoreum TaxID=659 RepID=UPI000D152549|nr:O-antigen ligase family protein [Photobacterium phosphoreum]PSU61817.1 hypothetical protein CTM79_21350 [Photobacterium phosphoreum]